MKVYLALDTHDLKLDLTKLKVNLKTAKNMEYRWVPENQWHIPICPLGEMDLGKFQLVDKLIEFLVKRHQAFELKLEGVWAYPTQEKGRLLWVGVQNARELRHLQSEVIKDLGAHFTESPEERPFRPHLPIVRLRSYRELTDLISPYKNTDFGKIMIRHLVIFEMTSGGAFPNYKKMKSYSLDQIETSDVQSFT